MIIIMTQELLNLRTTILEGRYPEALAIVDELEGMSKQAILRNIQSYLIILLIHLIKNQVEQRLTGSWATSIRHAIREIKKLNIKDNKKSYYINLDEWNNLIAEEIIDDAIADASEEVLNGAYSQFQLSELLNRTDIIENAITLLNLTYSHTPKELPTAIANILIQLPGGQEWIERQK